MKTNVRLRTKTRRKLKDLADLSEMTLSAIIHMLIEDKWVRVQRKIRAEKRKAEQAAAETANAKDTNASTGAAEPTQTASSTAMGTGDDKIADA